MKFNLKSKLCFLVILTSTNTTMADVFISKVSNFTARGYEVEFTEDNISDYSMLKAGLLGSGTNQKYITFNCLAEKHCSITIDERSELISKQADPTGIAVQEVHALYFSPRTSKKSRAFVTPVREMIRNGGEFKFVNAQILTGSTRSSCTSDQLGRRSCGRVPSVTTVAPSTGLALQSKSGNLICSESQSDFKSCVIATTEMIEAIDSQVSITARIGVHHLSVTSVQTECQVESDSGYAYNIGSGKTAEINIFFPNYPYRRYGGKFLKLLDAEETFTEKPLKEGDITCVAANQTDGIITEKLICTNHSGGELDFKVFVEYRTCNTPSKI